MTVVLLDAAAPPIIDAENPRGAVDRIQGFKGRGGKCSKRRHNL